MRFTTPCFVRVQNPQELKELREWCVSIGYGLPESGKNKRYDYLPIICVCENKVFRNEVFSVYGNNEYIDCGTNIPLFKALAAMNDENDCEQILTDGSRYIVCHLDNFHEYPRVNICTGDDGEHNIFEIVKTENWRKATAEEIINYFKNQRS